MAGVSRVGGVGRASIRIIPRRDIRVVGARRSSGSNSGFKLVINTININTTMLCNLRGGRGTGGRTGSRRGPGGTGGGVRLHGPLIVARRIPRRRVISRSVRRASRRGWYLVGQRLAEGHELLLFCFLGKMSCNADECTRIRR